VKRFSYRPRTQPKQPQKAIDRSRDQLYYENNKDEIRKEQEAYYEENRFDLKMQRKFSMQIAAQLVVVAKCLLEGNERNKGD